MSTLLLPAATDFFERVCRMHDRSRSAEPSSVRSAQVRLFRRTRRDRARHGQLVRRSLGAGMRVRPFFEARALRPAGAACAGETWVSWRFGKVIWSLSHTCEYPSLDTRAPRQELRAQDAIGSRGSTVLRDGDWVIHRHASSSSVAPGRGLIVRISYGSSTAISQTTRYTPSTSNSSPLCQVDSSPAR